MDDGGCTCAEDTDALWADHSRTCPLYAASVAYEDAATVEYVYYRHFVVYRAEADSVEQALRLIEASEDDGEMASVGVFVDGEPLIWSGYTSKEPPTPEQAERMRGDYAKSRSV